MEQIKARGAFLKSFDEFLHIVGNKSVYGELELRNHYNNDANLTVIELLYCGYFGAGNNVNWKWLKDNDCWPGTHPMNFHYTKAQFEKILREGNVDVDNVIID